MHLVHKHFVYVSTKHIAYFSLSFFCCFSLFSYVYVGVPWPWELLHVSIMGVSRHLRLWEHFFYVVKLFHFILLLWHVLVTFIGSCCIYLCCLTMGKFTTSWWEVNKSIVVIILLTFIILRLLYLILFVAGCIPYIAYRCYYCFL